MVSAGIFQTGYCMFSFHLLIVHANQPKGVWHEWVERRVGLGGLCRMGGEELGGGQGPTKNATLQKVCLPCCNGIDSSPCLDRLTNTEVGFEG